MTQKLIKMNRLTGSDQEIRDKLREIYDSKRAMLMEKTIFLGSPLFVYVFDFFSHFLLLLLHTLSAL